MWKRFGFFVSELLQSESPTSSLFALQAVDVTCVAGGNGQLLYADSEGGITICNQNYSLKRFQAHAGCINFAYLYKSSNTLLTISSDIDIRSEAAIAHSKEVANQYRKSLAANLKYEWILKDLGLSETVSTPEGAPRNEVKLWKMSTRDEAENPVCLRTFQLFQATSNEVVTALAVDEENDMLCVGCQSGFLFYIQGELTRSKYIQPSSIETKFNGPITGLHFAPSDKPSTLLLYCTSSTRTGVFSIVLSTRRNITFTSLSDSNGCECGCSCITDQHEFIVGRSTGLYRFQNGEECGCYSVPGAKQFVQSFKDCIFVSDSHEDKQRITIYNMQAHFIEYQGYVLRNGKSETITDVYTEWGDIFITRRNIPCSATTSWISRRSSTHCTSRSCFPWR